MLVDPVLGRLVVDVLDPLLERPVLDPRLHVGLRRPGLDRVVEQLGVGEAGAALRRAGSRTAGRGTSWPPSGPDVSSTTASALAARLEYSVLVLPSRKRQHVVLRAAPCPPRRRSSSAVAAGRLELAAERAQEVLVDRDLHRRRRRAGRHGVPDSRRRRGAGRRSTCRARTGRCSRCRGPARGPPTTTRRHHAVRRRRSLRSCSARIAAARGRAACRLGAAGGGGLLLRHRCLVSRLVVGQARQQQVVERPAGCAGRHTSQTLSSSRPTSRAISQGYFAAAFARSAPPPPKQPQSMERPRAHAERDADDERDQQHDGHDGGAPGEQPEQQAERRPGSPAPAARGPRRARRVSGSSW